MSDATPEISVIVPVYCNAGTLETLHARLCRALERYGRSFEILYVDDACPEGSAGILARLAGADRRTQALVLARNVGQHRAVLGALAEARGAWIVVMDADLQDPPEVIPTLVEAARRGGYDAVFGGRRGTYESRLRLATSRVFKGLLHRLCGVPADAGLFAVLRRPLVNRLLTVRMRRPSVVALVGLCGARCTSVPFTRGPRPIGGSAYTFGMRLSMAVGVLSSAVAARARPASTVSSTISETLPVLARLGTRWEDPREAGPWMHPPTERRT